MTDPSGMNLRLLRLVVYDALLLALVGGLGAYPTWTWSGRSGLVAEAAAAAIAMVASTAGGYLIALSSREGPARAAAGFVPAEAYRLGIAIAGSAAAWLAGASLQALLVWTTLFFLTTLYCEVVWLVKGLRAATGGEAKRYPLFAGLMGAHRAPGGGEDDEPSEDDIDWDDV